MKNINLLRIAATLLLSLVYAAAADHGPGSNTNTPSGQFYFVSGDGVQRPGRFVYQEGMTLTNAIHLTGGFTKWARKNHVELMRNGQNLAFVVDISTVQRGLATNVAIKPGDRIFVRGPTAIPKRWYDQLPPQLRSPQ